MNKTTLDAFHGRVIEKKAFLTVASRAAMSAWGKDFFGKGAKNTAKNILVGMKGPNSQGLAARAKGFGKETAGIAILGGGVGAHKLTHSNKMLKGGGYTI